MPQSIDKLISPRWIATAESDETLEHHSVAISHDTIAAILPTPQARQRYPEAAESILENHLLIPGLINLHTHAAMTLMRGLADDLPLMTWLQNHIWPAEAAHVSPDFVLDGTQLACTEMLLGGITCFNDMYFFPGQAAQAASEAGLRAVLGITTLEFPTAYASDADDYLNKGLAIREAWIDHPLIDFCLAPHAPYSVSDTTFRRIGILSEQLEMPIHCHIHETRTEIEQSLKQYGCRPVERLWHLGLLGPSFLGVHGVHLLPEEGEILERNGCHLAHCPTSNLKLGSGIAPIGKLLSQGLNIGLGTDGAASNNRLDLLSEMRLAALLAKGSTEDAAALPAQQALKMGTLNAAKALGIDNKVGSIKPGKQADLTAVDLGTHQCSPCFDPISHLIYVASRENVSDVWVAGQQKVHQKNLCTRNTNKLKKAIELWQNKLRNHPKT